MISSINDVYRDFMYKEKSKNFIIDYILNDNNKFTEYLLRLLISDWYKVGYITQDEKTLSFFHNDIDNIINLCLNNYHLLSVIYDEAKQFYDLPLVKKILVINNNLNKYEDNKIYKMCKFHVLDKVSYSFSYNLDDINEYYLDFIEKNKNSIQKNFIFEFITNETIKLFEQNISKYVENVVVFIREYYKWNYFKKSRLRDSFPFPNDNDYLDIVEYENFNGLINMSISNSDFLKTMIKNYLFYENFSSDEEKEKANKFLLENSSTELQKKLKIKGD